MKTFAPLFSHKDHMLVPNSFGESHPPVGLLFKFMCKCTPKCSVIWSMHAQCALDQNRDVLAIPGSIHNPNARGCHYLLQQGAKLVTSSEDVLGELGFDCEQLLPAITTTRLADENANLVGNDGKKNYFINKEGRVIQSAYQRIFIKHRQGQV